jgi:hypothetical protein
VLRATLRDLAMWLSPSASDECLEGETPECRPSRRRLWGFSDDVAKAYVTVMTTLPRLCPLSTYLCASTMSSKA